MTPNPKRQLPHDRHAEDSVIGAAFMRPKIVGWLQLEPEHFFGPRGRAVWVAMRALAARGEGIDVVTVEAKLGPETLEAIGGLAELSRMSLATPTADNVEHYAAILRRHYVSRQVMAECSQVIEQLFRGEDEDGEVRDELMARLARIDTGAKRADITLADAIREAQERLRSGKTEDLDIVFSGIPLLWLPIGTTTALGARPGTGKTALLMQMARGIAAETGGHSILLLWEDRAVTLARRALADMADVDGAKIRRHDLDMHERQRVLDATPTDVHERIHIVNCRGQTWQYAEREVRALASQYKICLLAADYLQRIRILAAEAKGLRTDERTRIPVDGFDALVGELACVGLMVSQLTRRTEHSEGEPTVSDYRDAPALEEICKLGLVAWSPGKGLVQVKAAKNNEGVMGGNVLLEFDAPHQRFHLYEEPGPQPMHGGDD